MFYNETPTASGNVLSFNVNPQPGDVIQFVSPVTNTATQVYTVTFSTGVSFPLSYGGEEIVQAYLLYNGQTYLAVFTGNSLEITAQQAADAQGDTVNTAPYVINNYLNPAYSGLLATQMSDLAQTVADVQQQDSFPTPVTMTSGLSVTGNISLTDGEVDGTATNSLALGGLAASGWAPLASPALTGVPTAPELTATSASDQIATMGSLNTGFIAPTLVSPTASETLPAGNFVIVQPDITAASTFTLPSSATQGAEYLIFGGAYAVTVATTATSGSPALVFPDNSQANSYEIPAGSSSAGVKCFWDTVNWRTQTFGQTVVASAIANNDAVQLGQLQDNSLSLSVDSISLSSSSSFPTTGSDVISSQGALSYAGNFSAFQSATSITASSTVLADSFFGGIFQFGDSSLEVVLPENVENENGVIWFLSNSNNANSSISCPGSGTFINLPNTPQFIPPPLRTGEYVGVSPAGGQNWQVQFASTSYMERINPFPLAGSSTFYPTNYSGSNQTTTGSITAGSTTLTLASALDFKNNQGILVTGAGASGAALITSIFSGSGTTSLTLNTAASTTVSNVAVYHDDTASLQSSLNKAGAVSGEVRLPPSTPQVSSIITVPTGVTLTGSAEPGTIIQASVDFSGYMFEATDPNNVTLKNFTLQGQGQSASGSGGIKFVISNNPYVGGLLFENLTVQDMPGNGIYINTPVTCTFQNITVQNTGGDGFYMQSGTSCTFNSCYSLNCLGSGHSFNLCTYFSVNSDASQQCGIDYHLVNSNNISFNGCGSEVPAYQGSYYSAIHYSISGCLGIVLSACYARSFTSVGSAAGESVYISSIGTSEVTAIGFRGVSSGNSPTATYYVDGTSMIRLIDCVFGGLNSTVSDVVLGGSAIVQSNNLTSLAGTTAGTITYSMPEQGNFKKFQAFASGYENDTTTAQAITFPTPFVNAPIVISNTTGLTVTASTTELNVSAPDATTTYSGYILIEGV